MSGWIAFTRYVKEKKGENDIFFRFEASLEAIGNRDQQHSYCNFLSQILLYFFFIKEEKVLKRMWMREKRSCKGYHTHEFVKKGSMFVLHAHFIIIFCSYM